MRIFAERKAKDPKIPKDREVKTDVKPRDSQPLELIRPPEGFQKPPDTVFSASGQPKDDVVDLEAAFFKQKKLIEERMGNHCEVLYDHDLCYRC